MKQRDEKSYLIDIVDSIEKLIYILENCSIEELNEDWLRQDVVVRRLEIIGEAASRISKETKDKYPEISWQLMKDMRNRLSHEYFNISAKIIYETVKNALPKELENIKKIT